MNPSDFCHWLKRCLDDDSYHTSESSLSVGLLLEFFCLENRMRWTARESSRQLSCLCSPTVAATSPAYCCRGTQTREGGGGLTSWQLPTLTHYWNSPQPQSVIDSHAQCLSPQMRLSEAGRSRLKENPRLPRWKKEQGFVFLLGLTAIALELVTLGSKCTLTATCVSWEMQLWSAPNLVRQSS